MSEHAPPNLDGDRTQLAASRFPWVTVLTAAGIVALVVAHMMCEPANKSDDSSLRFSAAYLVNCTFFLSISLGAMFFVMMQHLTRAGWSVTVRRLAEILAANAIWLGLPFLLILVPVLLGTSPLYRWSYPDAVGANELLRHKAVYLNGPFFAARAVVYFVVWGTTAWFYLSRSKRQDVSGDPQLTRRMEKAAPVAMILYAVTVTFASFDWLMSLTPDWFSTIFGAYFFSGAVVAALAVLVLFAMVLQSRGMVRRAITVEHYHDLGKLLLGFVVFWGYMAFSQYMLIWYANMPEETVWYMARQAGPSKWASLGLLFGHLLIPFLGLLSRDVKRRRILLAFWALWLLAAHWFDLYWLVMPTFFPERLPFGIADLGCFGGMACLFLAGTIQFARRGHLTPIGDPRLAESLAFENC
jgi:hypothetical protein